MKFKTIFTIPLLTSLLVPTTPIFASGPSNSVSDLNHADTWAKTAIQDVVNVGWIKGDPNGNFRPKDPITRREMSVIICKVMNINLPSGQDSPFLDVSPVDWGVKYINAVNNAGIMSGANKHFRPDDNITHEELAVILSKILELNVNQVNAVSASQRLPFIDSDSISIWAKPYVQAVVESRVMSGENGSHFNPKLNAQREEIALALDKVAWKTGNIKLYYGTWSAKLGKNTMYLVLNEGESGKVDVSLYPDNPLSSQAYFTVPVTFGSGSASFDSTDYAGLIQLKDRQIIVNIMVKNSNVTIMGSKTFNGYFTK